MLVLILKGVREELSFLNLNFKKSRAWERVYLEVNGDARS